MSGVEMVTLGCRLNAAESEAMRALAAGQADLVIVNSCAVTAEAVRQTAKEIRRAAKRRPGVRIVVTGCAAQIEPETFAAMPEVAAVLGNREKWDAANFAVPHPVGTSTALSANGSFGAAAKASGSGPSTALGTNGSVKAPRETPFVPSEVEVRAADASPGSRPSTALGTNGAFKANVHVSDIMAPHDSAPPPAGLRTRARAFVEVQNGCDHRCTFCIIPFGRGPSRSVPAGAVIERIRALVDEGCNEVVLTGVDTTSYGPDLPGDQSLGHLVERVLKLVPGLKRLRLSSLDSVEIDDRLFDLVTGDERMQPHLHLSLQAGDDMVLKRMKRRHSRAQSVAMIQRLKAARPDIAIGADLIAGFPTETEAQALGSLALLDDCDIVFGHVFPYSPRAGTPAARMPQVEPAVVKARAKRLRDAADMRRARWLGTLIGTTQQVLIEGQDGRGHAGNYAPARLTRTTTPRGAIATMRVTHVEDGHLVGDPV